MEAFFSIEFPSSQITLAHAKLTKTNLHSSHLCFGDRISNGTWSSLTDFYRLTGQSFPGIHTGLCHLSVGMTGMHACFVPFILGTSNSASYACVANPFQTTLPQTVLSARKSIAPRSSLLFIPSNMR